MEELFSDDDGHLDFDKTYLNDFQKTDVKFNENNDDAQINDNK